MSYRPYTLSEELKKAQEALDQQLAAKPQDYRSAWEDALKQAMDGLLNRESFAYDPGSDPLYQNYRQQHVRDGKLAMLDTLGKSQAMTGGYGNSYAQTAAQQTYGSYLDQLSGKLPELYQLALSQYGLEGQAMSDRLELLQQREDQDYSRWRDTLNAWQTRTDSMASRLESQKNQDYSRWESDRDYALKQEELAAQQQRWQAEFDESKRQFEVNQAAKEAATASKGGGGAYAGNQGIDVATVRKAQQFVGTKVDGMWGKNSASAAKAKGYDSLQAVIAAMGGSIQSTGSKQEAYTITDGAAAVKRLAEAGTAQTSLSAYIARLVTEGKLTRSEADSLRRQYLDPVYYQ